MLHDQLREIFATVQNQPGSQKRYLQILHKIYKESPKQEFVNIFSNYLAKLFFIESHFENFYRQRCFTFAVEFTLRVHKSTTESHNEEEEDGFIYKIIKYTLEFYNAVDKQLRHSCCLFISAILDGLDDDYPLNDEAYTLIQKCMLDRVQDIKANIRVAAVDAIYRLQDPINPDCPVILELTKAIDDPNANVRLRVVTQIAPCPLSLPKIVSRVFDIDFRVRRAAYMKCAAIKPTYLKIIDRQLVLQTGFSEMNALVKKTFLEVLLPKWLGAYNGNFLNFLTAIKLDADENDVETSDILSTNLMQAFFKSYPIKDIIGCLPIDEDRLLPVTKLSHDTISYWSMLHRYLLRCNSDDLLEKIIPELSLFCGYIERVIQEKFKPNFEHWQLLEYQFVLMKLFEMAGYFDLSDEVGRQTLHGLVINTLLEKKLHMKILSKMMDILAAMSIGDDHLIGEICDVINNLMEPEVEIDIPLTADQEREKKFKMAELKIKHNILAEEVEDALKERNHQLAIDKQRLVVELEERMAAQKNEWFQVEKVKQVATDSETLGRCLDLLISLLELSKVKKVNDLLRECKEKLLERCGDKNNLEVYHRILRVILLYATIDLDTARDNLKFIYSPTYFYRSSPENNVGVNVLTSSIKGMTDLIRIYKQNLFSMDTTVHQTNRKRRLYQCNDSIDVNLMDLDEICIEDVIETMLYLQDDPDPVIRESAGIAISHLLYDGIMISSSVMSRIFLKWVNPLEEKMNPKVQQMLAVSITHFANLDGSEDIIMRAIIPTLRVIVNAPRTSPFMDVNLDKIISIFAYFINIPKKNSIGQGHKLMAYILCSELANQPQDRCTPVLVKMLLHLNVPQNDKTALIELRQQADLILEDLADKTSIKKMKQYKALLIATAEEETTLDLLPNSTLNNTEGHASTTETEIHKRGIRKDLEIANNSDEPPNKKQKIEESIEETINNKLIEGSTYDLNEYQKNSVMDTKKNVNKADASAPKKIRLDAQKITKNKNQKNDQRCLRESPMKKKFFDEMNENLTSNVKAKKEKLMKKNNNSKNNSSGNKQNVSTSEISNLVRISSRRTLSMPNCDTSEELFNAIAEQARSAEIAVSERKLIKRKGKGLSSRKFSPRINKKTLSIPNCSTSEELFNAIAKQAKLAETTVSERKLFKTKGKHGLASRKSLSNSSSMIQINVDIEKQNITNNENGSNNSKDASTLLSSKSSNDYSNNRNKRKYRNISQSDEEINQNNKKIKNNFTNSKNGTISVRTSSYESCSSLVNKIDKSFLTPDKKTQEVFDSTCKNTKSKKNNLEKSSAENLSSTINTRATHRKINEINTSLNKSIIAGKANRCVLSKKLIKEINTSRIQESSTENEFSVRNSTRNKKNHQKKITILSNIVVRNRKIPATEAANLNNKRDSSNKIVFSPRETRQLKTNDVSKKIGDIQNKKRETLTLVKKSTSDMVVPHDTLLNTTHSKSASAKNKENAISSESSDEIIFGTPISIRSTRLSEKRLSFKNNTICHTPLQSITRNKNADSKIPVINTEPSVQSFGSARRMRSMRSSLSFKENPKSKTKTQAQMTLTPTSSKSSISFPSNKMHNKNTVKTNKESWKKTNIEDSCCELFSSLKLGGLKVNTGRISEKKNIIKSKGYLQKRLEEDIYKSTDNLIVFVNREEQDLVKSAQKNVPYSTSNRKNKILRGQSFKANRTLRSNQQSLLLQDANDKSTLARSLQFDEDGPGNILVASASDEKSTQRPKAKNLKKQSQCDYNTGKSNDGRQKQIKAVSTDYSKGVEYSSFGSNSSKMSSSLSSPRAGSSAPSVLSTSIYKNKQTFKQLDTTLSSTASPRKLRRKR